MDKLSEYKVDYFSKYYFYEEEDFLEKIEDGNYILNQIKESNRFDYKGHSFKYTKFGNISMGDTKRDVDVVIDLEQNKITINGENAHLDLIYKFETKELEDHMRIATRISEKTDDISCLLYVNNAQSKSFIKDLEYIKKIQEDRMNKR